MCVSKSAELVDFSVRNVFDALRTENAVIPWSKLVWSAYCCMPKHAFLLWLALGRKLKTQDRMKIWDGLLQITSSCLLCKSVVETHDHLFFDCS